MDLSHFTSALPNGTSHCSMFSVLSGVSFPFTNSYCELHHGPSGPLSVHLKATLVSTTLETRKMRVQFGTFYFLSE